MNLTILSEIENQIFRLSQEEQLWLMERLARKLRENH